MVTKKVTFKNQASAPARWRRTELRPWDMQGQPTARGWQRWPWEIPKRIDMVKQKVVKNGDFNERIGFGDFLGVTYGVMVTSMVILWWLQWWFQWVWWWFNGDFMELVDTWLMWFPEPSVCTQKENTQPFSPNDFGWEWLTMALVFSTQKPLFKRGLENIVGRPCKRRV